MKKTIATILSVLVIALFMASCGGGSGGAAAGRSINLGGIVMAPTVSGNISAPKALLSKVLPEDGISSGAVCTIYTLEGETLGSDETNSAGEFSVSVLLSDLKGAEDDASTWSELVVVSCDNGIELFKDVSIDEGDLDNVDLGTADFDTTLTSNTFAQTTGDFAGWGNEYKDAMDNLDILGLNFLFDSMWEKALLSGHGIADDIGAIREIIAAFMANGGSFADLGYDSWSELIQTILNGDVSAESWNAMVADVSGILDTDADTLEGYRLPAFASFTVITTFLTEQTTEPADDEPNYGMWGDIDDDTSAAAYVGTLLEAEDAETAEDDLQGPAGSYMEDLLEHCLEEEEVNDVIPCEDMATQPAAYYELLHLYNEQFAGSWDGSTIDAATAEGIYIAAKSCDGETFEELKKCAEAMYETVYTAAGGDWDSFKTDGTFDTSLFSWAKYYAELVEDETDITKLDYETMWTEYADTMASEETYDCISDSADSDVSSCFEEEAPSLNVPENLDNYNGYYHFSDITNTNAEACNFDGAGDYIYVSGGLSYPYDIVLYDNQGSEVPLLSFSSEYDSSTGLVTYTSGSGTIVGQFYYTADLNVEFIFLSGLYNDNTCVPGDGKIYSFTPMD